MITFEIHQEALKAAEQACADFENKHPNFMDACGFAWVQSCLLYTSPSPRD